jgi:hypothetical protein
MTGFSEWARTELFYVLSGRAKSDLSQRITAINEESTALDQRLP